MPDSSLAHPITNKLWPSRGAAARRWVVGLMLLALVCWWATDWHIYASEPAATLRQILWGLVTPTVGDTQQLTEALAITLAFSLIAVCTSFITGILLSLFYQHPLVAALCSAIRAVHELFWALLFLQIFGLSWSTAFLAVILPYSAIFARVFFDIYQHRKSRLDLFFSDNHSQPLKYSKLFYELLPQCWPEMKVYLRYRLECGFRTAAILGFVGIPTLGYYLDTFFKEAHFSEAGAWLLAFVILIFSLRYWFRIKWLPFLFIASVFFLPEQNAQFDWQNVARFFSQDIWPTRLQMSDSVMDGLLIWIQWAGNLSIKEALPGLWQTFALTCVAVVLVFWLVQLQLAISWPQLQSRWCRPVIHFLLLLLRSIPEYIFAFVLLLVWGPSMLPAAVALALHNGGLIGYLTTRAIEERLIENKVPENGNVLNENNSWLYFGLPNSFNGFFSLLLYRAEIIFRESSILGILGIGTIGFYIDSAFEDFRLDKAFVLLIWLIIGNVVFDRLAQMLQRRITGTSPKVYSRQG